MLPSRRFPLTRQSQQSDSQRLINLQFMHSPLGQPGSSAHSLILLYASHTSLHCGAVRYAADTIGLSSHLFPLRLLSLVSLARPNTEEDWHCTAVWAQLCCGGQGFHFLTATASQATSPAVTTWRQQRRVQFQWRRLSCPLAPVCLVEAPRGPLVLQGNQMRVRGAERARVNSTTAHRAVRLCPPQQGGPGMLQPLPCLPRDACDSKRCQQPPVTVAWGEAADRDVSQLSSFPGSSSS